MKAPKIEGLTAEQYGDATARRLGIALGPDWLGYTDAELRESNESREARWRAAIAAAKVERDARKAGAR